MSATATSQATGAVLPVAPTLTIISSALSVNEDNAVTLGIGETPFNLQDPVSVTISGIPSDATLTDSHNDTLTISNGGITLTPAELAGLTLHAGGTSANLTVTAINTAGATASTSQNLHVTVNPAAPTLTVPGSITLHDWGTAPLNITDIAAHANDTLGNVTISGLPSGAALSNSNHDTLSIANGSVTLTAAQLAGLTLHAGASDTTTILTVVASESDAEHATATTTKTISLTVSGRPVLDVTGTSATGSVPSSALTAAAASYLTDNHNLINTLGGTNGFGSVVTFNGSATQR